MLTYVDYVGFPQLAMLFHLPFPLLTKNPARGEALKVPHKTCLEWGIVA
jgi:hypothetical protein